MDWKIIVAAPLAAWLVVANAAGLKMPYNWGSDAYAPNSHAYQIGLDREVSFNGQPALTVRTTQPVDETYFGAATTSLDSTGYEGRRVRFSGMLKTTGVLTYAGVYLRSNRSDRREWNFGEAANLPRGSASTVGTSDWHPVSVVIDVLPNQGATMDMGLVLVGGGQAWLSDLKFDEVGDDVPPTISPIGLDTEKFAQARKRSAEKDALTRVKTRPDNLALKELPPSP